MKVAIFPGSFDPFTIGHASIVDRALPIFDKIVIGVGFNASKRSLYTPEERVQNIAEIYATEPKIEVVSYTDLTIDLCKRHNAHFIVRGLRSIKDYEYEHDVASMNKRLGNVDTVMFFCDERFSYISSSVVRELIAFGKDVSDFIPSKPHNPNKP